MSKKVIRLITLVLAIAMVATLAVGCGGNGDTPGGTSNSGGNSNAKVNGMLAEVDPEDYRGTTVVLATRTDPYANEDGPVCDKFEEKYGINFEYVLIDGPSYVSTIASRISSGQQTDVYFENGDFPGSLTVMQPLDNAKFDLSAPIWNQSLIKASTLEGHAYLVDAISNVWTELDVCVYNQDVFDKLELPTPAEYYERGEWTFANFRYLASEISKEKGYMGASVLDESLCGAANASVFLYEDGKMKLGVDKHFKEVLTYMGKMREDGYIKLDRHEGFNQGKTGMAITNCFGLKRTGYFTKVKSSCLRATYLPVWEKGSPLVYTGIYRGWGLVDGSANPVAAGIFIRYYLDGSNYDMDKTFHNEHVRDFFFELTRQYPDNVLYYRGPDMEKTTGMGESHFGYLFQYQPSNQINSLLDEKIPVMNEMIDKANDIIEQERIQIKQYENDGKINKLS
ncbi:MAG: carbohydrate ABC transporter substrate-binding protein [Clostridia bacterium]|nr:carbohydrate ABC transporter substrate-binding protein [Clostridia bacterium]